MTKIILIITIIISSLLFGLSYAYWYVSKQIKEISNVGDYIGNENAYSHCYTELEAKDNVSNKFDINMYDIY